MRIMTECSADKWSGRVEYAGDPDGRLVEIHTWPPWARRLTVALARLVTLHWLRRLRWHLLLSWQLAVGITCESWDHGQADSISLFLGPLTLAIDWQTAPESLGRFGEKVIWRSSGWKR